MAVYSVKSNQLFHL